MATSQILSAGHRLEAAERLVSAPPQRTRFSVGLLLTYSAAYTGRRGDGDRPLCG
jgi:hypothetical protein